MVALCAGDAHVDLAAQELQLVSLDQTFEYEKHPIVDRVKTHLNMVPVRGPTEEVLLRDVEVSLSECPCEQLACPSCQDCFADTVDDAPQMAGNRGHFLLPDVVVNRYII